MRSSSLLHALRQRERGFTKELKATLVQKTCHNLITGTSTTKILELQKGAGDNHRVSKTERYGNFVATINNGILALHDISINKKLWSLALPDISGQGYGYPWNNNFKLNVSDDGTVTCKVEKKGWDNKPLILIFHQGKYIGEIINTSLWQNSLRIIQGRIFALSCDGKLLYEWKKTGELIRSLSLDEENRFGTNPCITHHDDLLVITGQPQGEEGKLPIFIFDLNSNEHRIDNIKLTENYYISKIFLDGNKILLGEQHNHSDRAHRLDSKIAIFNILTREIEIEYPLDGIKNNFLRLFATGNAIVFLTGRESFSETDVFNLNMKNKSFQKITTLPMCVEGRYPEFINISSVGNLLMIGHPVGYWNTGWSASCLKVINLDTLQIIKDTQYRRFPFFDKFSFENGLLFNSTDFKNMTFLIQDFASIQESKELEENANAVASF